MSVDRNWTVIRRYSGHGLSVGLALGFLAGILIGGPRFRQWESPAVTWALVTAATSAVGAVLGVLFFWLISPNTGAAGDYGGDAGPDAGDGGGGE